MINYIKNDFRSVRDSLGYFLGKVIPLWIAIPYYVIVGIIALPFVPFVWVWYKIQMKRLKL